VAAPVMSDHAETVLGKKKQHLRIQSSAVSGHPWLKTMGCPLPQSL